MNSESFVEYLAQPAKLYQLPYQEIKNLVAEYPYAANLRLLMFIKSKIEQDPAFEIHLHQLAAHTFDRDHLFDLDHQGLKDKLDLATGHEERLELKQLSDTVNKELAGIEIGTSTAISEPMLKATAIPTSIIIDNIEDSVHLESAVRDESRADESPTVETIVENTIASINKTEDPIESFKLDMNLMDDISFIPLLTSAPEVQAKENFSVWKVFINDNNQERLDRLKKKAKQNTDAFNLSTQQAAASSVKQKPGVATETLAKLLERQGNYQKAIKMYEQLSLLNPEKSHNFAATIEKLKLNI